ncbi:unnamed protein product [Sympodiomycopsis kandeliae]
MSSSEASASASSSSTPVSSSQTSPSATSADLPPIPTQETLSLSPSERESQGSQLKDAGNKFFLAGDFENAKIKYGESITMNPNDVKVWSNRAACELKLEQHGLAIEDASKAIALDAKFSKAYFRRASAYLAILQPRKALPDLQMILKLEPGNAQVRAQAMETQKLIRQLAFAEAIRVEDGPSIASQVEEQLKNNTAATNVPSTYTGPHLPKGPQGEEHLGSISQEFIEEMITYFQSDKGRLPAKYVWQILLGANRAFLAEDSLVDYKVEPGTTIDVIGDTHGQLFDFLNLLDRTGKPSESHALLFNGDLVDRGSYGVEIVLIAFAYKWLYPRRVFIDRGNHEAASLNSVYGFEAETKEKYKGETTYKLFSEVFVSLPLSTLITASEKPVPVEDLPWDASHAQSSPILSPSGHKRFFVVHGGIFSKDGVTLEDIRKIPRTTIKQPGQEGLMMEMLWADPQSANGRAPSKRGVGLGFGPDVTKAFCKLNGITAILRSHEMRQEGYTEEHDGLCVTLFSAPSYCGVGDNKGAFARIDSKGTMRYTKYQAVPPQGVKPMAYTRNNLGGML